MADTLDLVQRKIEFRQEVLHITDHADGPLTLKELAAESDWIDITRPQDMNTLRGIAVALEKDGYLVKKQTGGKPSWLRTSKKYDPIEDDVALMEATELTHKKQSKSDLLSVMQKTRKAADDTHHTVSQKLNMEIKALRDKLTRVSDEDIKSECMHVLDGEFEKIVSYIREMEIDIKMLNAEKDNFIKILNNVGDLINDIA